MLFASVAAVMVLVDRLRSPYPLVLPVFVFAAGCVTSYVSFLLNTPLAPALIAFVVVADWLRKDDPHRVRKGLLWAAGLAALWFAGYVGTWVSKWIVAAATLGPDMILLEVRSAGAGYTSGELYDSLSVLEPTWLILSQTAEYSPHPKMLSYVLFTWIVTAAIIGMTAFRRRLTLRALIEFAALVAPLLIVFAYTEATRGHSVLHTGYSYRSLLLFSVLPPLAAFWIARTAPARRTATAVAAAGA